jgi:hypothetical protein
MTRDNDHYEGGTSHGAFFVFVLAAALFVVSLGYSIWPGFQPKKEPAMSDGSQVQAPEKKPAK